MLGWWEGGGWVRGAFGRCGGRGRSVCGHPWGQGGSRGDQMDRLFLVGPPGWMEESKEERK